MAIRARLTGNPTTLEGQLRERLDVLDGDALELQKRLDLVTEERDLVRRLLELEMRRTGHTDPKRRRDLGDIVKDALINGTAAKSSLNMEAMHAGHVSPGRGVHAILMGFVNHGYAEKVSGDHFIITPKGIAAFAKSGEDGS